MMTLLALTLVAFIAWGVGVVCGEQWHKQRVLVIAREVVKSGDPRLLVYRIVKC